METVTDRELTYEPIETGPLESPEGHVMPGVREYKVGSEQEPVDVVVVETPKDARNMRRLGRHIRAAAGPLER